jgi:abortive infection bacteriophage resistance protein
VAYILIFIFFLYRVQQWREFVDGLGDAAVAHEYYRVREKMGLDEDQLFFLIVRCLVLSYSAYIEQIQGR